MANPLSLKTNGAGGRGGGGGDRRLSKIPKLLVLRALE